MSAVMPCRVCQSTNVSETSEQMPSRGGGPSMSVVRRCRNPECLSNDPHRGEYEV